MKIFIFGNGNISFDNFVEHYSNPLKPYLNNSDVEFVICDFRGTDTLTMELLKSISSNVTVCHIGEKPRYAPDKYKTKASQWTFKGGFISDEERDNYAIKYCTHFLAVDYNSNNKRVSGTEKNINKCLSMNKERLVNH